MPIQHTPLTLDLARQYGIPEHIIASTPTSDLRAEISLLQQQQAFRPPQQQQLPPQEPQIDWGVNPENGKPYTEADFNDYPMHQQLVKQNHKLKMKMDAIEREQQELKRSSADAARQTTLQQFHALCDSNPEVFGSPDAAPGSPEAISREMMYNQLASLVSAKKHTTMEADFARMLPAFKRQAASTQPSASNRITPEQWRQSGLAQAAHRNMAPMPKTRRQQIAERVDDEMRRNGIKVPTGTYSDLSDLPPR